MALTPENANVITSTLGAAGNIAGGLINHWSAKKLMEMQNEYNKPSNQLKRYLEAGFNPNAVMQGITGAEGAGNMNAADSSSIPNPLGPNLGNDIRNITQDALNAKLMQSQIEKNNSETEGNKINNDFNTATFATRVKQCADQGIITEKEAENATVFAEKYPELLDQSLEQIKENINKTKAEIDQINKNIDLMDQKITESKKLVDKYEQDIKTAKSEEAKNYAQAELAKAQTNLTNLNSEKQEMENQIFKLKGDGGTGQYLLLEEKYGKEYADNWLKENTNTIEKIQESSAKGSAQGQQTVYDNSPEGIQKREYMKERDDKIKKLENEIKDLEKERENASWWLKGNYTEDIQNKKEQITKTRDEYAKKIAEVDKGKKTGFSLSTPIGGINYSY